MFFLFFFPALCVSDTDPKHKICQCAQSCGTYVPSAPKAEPVIKAGTTRSRVPATIPPPSPPSPPPRSPLPALPSPRPPPSPPRPILLLPRPRAASCDRQRCRSSRFQ